MSAHTPGPWVNGDGDKESILSSVNWNCVAQANKVFEEWPANARLLAAAPELLEALQTLIGQSGAGLTFCERIAVAKAAIAKALGEIA